MGEVKRQKGETERHFLARKIFLRYLGVKKKEVKGSKIDFEFPPYGGRARADLALIIEKPPVAVIEIWVEIQDTKLTEAGWKKKLRKIVEIFNPNDIYVAITENLSTELFSIIDVVSKILDKYGFFLIDTRKELIYDFCWREEMKVHKIYFEKGEMIKKKIEISLDRFLR